LAKKQNSTRQGWVPSAYLKEEPQAAPRPVPPPPPSASAAARTVRAPLPATNGMNGAAKAKATPPVPPTKRPAAGKKPAASIALRDSSMSLTSNSGDGNGRSTPNSLAGGLAEALRQRQNAMQRAKDDDDDW